MKLRLFCLAICLLFSISAFAQDKKPETKPETKPLKPLIELNAAQSDDVAKSRDAVVIASQTATITELRIANVQAQIKEAAAQLEKEKNDVQTRRESLIALLAKITGLKPEQIAQYELTEADGKVALKLKDKDK